MQHFLGLKTILVLLTILIGSLSIPAQAATFTVTKLADTSDGVCDADCSLREAITAANSVPGNDIIAVTPGVTGTIELKDALPDFTSNITLNGPGAGVLTVARSTNPSTPLFRVFTIGSGFVVNIARLTISNGSVTGSGVGAAFGGGISNNGTLNLTSCAINNNVAAGSDGATVGAKGSDAQGGAIFNNANLTLVSCTLSDNSATGGNGNTTGNGGAALGGAIYSISDGISVTDCTFGGNTAQGGDGANGGVAQGGAIRIDGNLSLTRSTLNANSATGGFNADGQGGAIYNTNGAGTYASCTLSNNIARGSDDGVAQGGGIRSDANLVVTKSSLRGNSAEGGDNSGQGGAASGGGIYNSATLKVISSTLNDNAANGGNSGNGSQGGAGLGGGIYNSSVAILTLTNSTLSSNDTLGGTSSGSAGIGRGGGLFMQGSTTGGGQATVVSATIVGNTAGDGGGILNSSGTLTLNNTIVALNTGTPNPDVRGAVNASSKFNLIGIGTAGLTGITNGTNGNQIGTAASPIDPLVGALQSNGGPTQTHGLLPGSPAIDQGKAFTVVDQRGEDRPFDYATIANAVGGDGSDIGAFESQRILVSVETARTVAEGDAANPGSTNFIIRISAPSNLPVTVDYQTSNGTAIAGSDYVAKNGTLTFTTGQTSKLVSVRFIGDTVPEADEFFYLNLLNSTNSGISDPRGSATIRNDDGPSLSIESAVAVSEGNAGNTAQTFTVTLSAASTDTVTVDYATQNDTATTSDYVAATGKLTFAPGETTKTITVQVKGDTTVETDESYAVNLLRPAFAVIADGQGTAVIVNDDTAPLQQLFEDEPSQ